MTPNRTRNKGIQVNTFELTLIKVNWKKYSFIFHVKKRCSKCRSKYSESGLGSYICSVSSRTSSTSGVWKLFWQKLRFMLHFYRVDPESYCYVLEWKATKPYLIVYSCNHICKSRLGPFLLLQIKCKWDSCWRNDMQENQIYRPQKRSSVTAQHYRISSRKEEAVYKLLGVFSSI